MLGQKLESNLKSETLPRLDGHDEDGEGLESQFDIGSIANSCPDLSTLDSPESHSNGSDGVRISPVMVQHGEDGVDCIFYKTVVIPNKLPLSFRRSTSLNSLGVEQEFGTRGASSTVDGGTASVLQPGRVAKVIGQLEKSLKKETNNLSQQHSTEFVRSNLRASHNGTGFLHKSVSTSSVPQYFGSSSNALLEQRNKNSTQVNLRQPQISDVIQPHSTKRSFFRRKNKSKGGSLNSHSHPPVVVQYFRSGDMNGILGSHNDERMPESLGHAALHDLSLGLQDADAECWALSMSPDVVSQLDEKEVKRQEHMYELILTEKHHCLTLALMHHLFVGGMKKIGLSRQARLLFPDLKELLQVHFAFLRRMRERQLKFRELNQPMDTLADILIEQFTGDQWKLMIGLYGLLCASHAKSLEMFKVLLKDPKFASLVSTWDKEPLLSRKNVRECLLLVAQRITKYPLLFEPLLKTAVSQEEKDSIKKALTSSRDLISKVNERVAERERLIDICQRIDPKSYVVVGDRRRGKEDIMAVPSRRLLFYGQAVVNCNRVMGANSSSASSIGAAASTRSVSCTVLILTDSLIFTQEFSGRLHFVSPPGVVMLNNLIVRENAGQTSSLFLVLGTGTSKPEMIELQITNPLNREIWMDRIRDAISKFEEDGEACSDADEELSTDSIDLSDIKTTRALEELQEQDKQLLQLLRSRTKLVDNLRSERPYNWSTNHFDGKDSVLSAVSHAANEVQHMIRQLDSTGAVGVNRSASCVSDHMSSVMLSGLPKRADTFGGFDSQQRIAMEFPHSDNSKLLLQMVIQLADLCGEMFQQMVPHITPHVYQNHHQLQRRMEDLREAQQRLETEKALWQQELSSQREEIDKQKVELNSLKESLQKEQADISQQREQLYRKLEALQRQGIRPNLDAVSPNSINPSVEKSTSSVVPARRPPIATQPSTAPPPVSTNASKQKQQLPLHLAASSSFKGSIHSGPSEPPKPVPRSSLIGNSKGNPPGGSSSQSQMQNHNSGENMTSGGSRLSQGSQFTSVGSRRGGQPPPVQQLLPFKLSEGTTMKTSSLPRGVGSRSTSNMMIPSEQPIHQNSGQMRTSVSSSQFLHHMNSGDSSSNLQNSSYLHGPATNDRMSSYYRNPHTGDARNGGITHSNNGYMEYSFASNTPTGVSIVHRRSGSSPVPMSATVQQARNQNTLLYQTDDDVESKILFL